MPCIVPVPRHFAGALIVLFACTAIAAAQPKSDKPDGKSAQPAADPSIAAPPDHAIVAGFERFYSAPNSDKVAGGRLLLGDLNCTSCHAVDGAAAESLFRKQAPNLDTVGARVRPQFLRKFLADPHGTKAGTTMPNLLAGVPEGERKEQIEALVHFLASTGTINESGSDPKGVAPGRDLFHKVGCVACHGSRDGVPTAGNGEPVNLPTNVPMGNPHLKYSATSLTAFLKDPLAVRPSGRMPNLNLQDPEIKQLVSYLIPPTGAGGVRNVINGNLKYSYYEGEWQKLPDFATLKPKAEGKVKGFDLSAAQREQNMALRFEGFLQVPKTGTYSFYLHSDDGSKLWIDNKVVVDNDGVHSPAEKSNTIKLSAGSHPLTVAVFNAGGGVELKVDIEGEGVSRVDPSNLVTLTAGATKPVEPEPKTKSEDDFTIDFELVQKGRELFAKIGCASCHQLRDRGQNINSKLTAGSLAKLKGTGGCLSSTANRGLPQYALNDVQRASLSVAIADVAKPSTEKLAAAERVHRTLATFNCYACHNRGELGGVEEARNPHFQTTQKEMGDEARIPPPLTGVGAKLKNDWLNNIVSNGGRDRPYMHTRMPKFGGHNTGHLTKLFEDLDVIESFTPPTPKVPLRQLKAEGRFLVGGQALSCIKCHTFNNIPATGVQALDLTSFSRRLKPDWFYRYMLDPPKLRPGTRMPAPWPGGKTLLKKVLDGDALMQLHAVWTYCLDGSNAAIPLGLGRDPIELIATNEAVMYRNFIEGAGPRAIGVAYPERVDVAFDANALRLALIWQGQFIDASKHWLDRGAGFQKPLGDNILKMAEGPSFATLEKPDAKWPDIKSAKEIGQQFLGYTLSKDRRPTFEYSLPGNVKVEDFPTGVPGSATPTLRRVLALSAISPPAQPLWFRAAAANKIADAGGGWYTIDDWKMKLESSEKPVIRDVGGKFELLVPVNLSGKQAKIVQEFVW